MDKRLNGSRMNNVAHNFKGNAFASRYAKIVARHGVSPVSAVSTNGVTTSNLINFAYAQPVSIENGTVVIEGIEGSVFTSQSTRNSFDSPTVDYDIMEGRVISGSGQALDARLLDIDNNVRASRLIPRRTT